jgi:type I restriction-modification system DNA methylase subunit
MKETLKQISNLVERFERNIEAYRSPAYNETQLRREFVDPFFEALGWDVTNKAGYAEQYKDVIHEDAIKIAGATKAPDYCFRIGGVRKFFLETKKPSIDIKGQIDPAYQLRRYAWSSKLPLSILTDFEELAIYDCRLRPKPSDKPSIGRVRFYTYTQYLDSFEDIYNLLSKESVLKGSFDKFAESERQKRGTTEVDAEFLKEIESWREALAKDIAFRNPSLSVRELNFAVQLTIDRIIFLRMCEDRGIENYGQIQNLLNGTNTYRRLREIFYHADDKYNSGLFDFKTDRLTPEIKVDDKPLKDIFKTLYYPESPYEFSVLGADILGHVYEQFLGKVIRLTEGHRAKVEEKPEVRKAGGVYYTPTYIVDYIVKNTVGKIVGAGLSARRVGAAHCGRPEEGTHREVPLPRQLTPKQISKIRILDPACGSGSFLLGAYQHLLDYHLNWYLTHHSKKGNVAQGFSPAPKEMYRGRGGQWYLTIQEKKRILLNNIYGVDIDPQAVEVTKLSLLLKVLEGENQDTLEKQMKLFRERALPDLGSNIKCGNSLIGPDFYSVGAGLALPGLSVGARHVPPSLNEEEIYRINAFDWEKEFPEIIKQGGFDAVIGNPPYVRQEGLGDAKAYFQSHYKTFRPTADLYVNFIERGLGLLKKTGLFGMIVSNKWLRAAYGKPLREFLSSNASVLQLIDLAGLPVFARATVRTIILICSPVQKQRATIRYLAPVPLDDFRTINTGERLQELANERALELPISSLSPDGWSLSGHKTKQVIENIKQVSVSLRTYIQGKPLRGIITGLNEAFIIDRMTRNRLIAEDPKSSEIIKPLLTGRDVRRYNIGFANRYLIWTYIGIPIERYPAIFKHLKQFQPQLQKRWDKGNYWWELRGCDYYDKFEKPKIIYPDIATTCRFALDQNGYFSSNTTYFIPNDYLYLLGILNSKLGQFYFSDVCAGLEGGGSTYLRFFGQYLEGFPVRTINFSDPDEKACHDRMVKLVEQMQTFHKQLPAAKTPDDKTRLQRLINATDHQIDHLVYELYGLTEKEIQIVEQRTS